MIAKTNQIRVSILTMNKITIFSILIVLFLAGCKYEFRAGKKNQSYYIDSFTGDDKHSGTSVKKAWKSLQRISRYSFKPGDEVFLSGGGFDFDGGMRYSIMQYNLSAFNEEACYGIFQYEGAGDWHDNIARYNITFNDGSKNGQCGILIWCDPAANQIADNGGSDFWNNCLLPGKKT